jgi:type II secretory pathway component GspD/PulD (secretin)
MIKPLATIAICAFAISAFAQSQTVKIKSKGQDIRTVIDSIFDQTGKQYVLETNFHQSLFMSIDGVSFEKAIDIISKIADMEFEERQGIWYIHKKPITAAHRFSGATPAPKSIVPTINPKPTKAPAKSTGKESQVVKKTAAKPTTAKVITAAQSFSGATTPIELDQPKVSLTGRLTVQLKKMDIRDVFSEFGRQAKVDIELDDSVPNYKLDAAFYNTTLKFAIEKVCKVAGLKYSITPSNTIRISKI